MARMMLCILLAVVLLLEQPQLTKGCGVMERPLSPSVYDSSILDAANNLNSSIPVYHIIYNLNLGENHYLNPSVYYEQLLPMKLMPPKREGYNFAGWYTDSSYKHPLTGIEDCQNGNLILYAKWTKKISGTMNIQLYSYGAGSLTRSPEKKLSNMNYRILEDLDIPGMPGTRFEDYINNKLFSVDQCPQGLCVTEEHILVTSYSTGNHENYGSLYVFDRRTGAYLVTLSMKKGSHLGGICYDGENLWICHSNYRTIERLDYALVKEIARHQPGRTVELTQKHEEYRVSNSPSCITFFSGKLWIATHTRFFKSIMKSYRYSGGALEECEEFAIPDKVQGVAFDEDGHVYLSTSFGRDKSSYIKVYHSAYDLSKRPEKPAECVEMPPCSEELAIAGDELLVLFESGAQKYMEGTDGKGKALAPLDHMVAIQLDSFAK
ncbi:MAG: InlB B-repeat-containing protein [Eubacterium sp.]|nr:InlB B-repeat-containing protein [Eubacterium sp.]